MPLPKLIYFATRGRAEVTRLVLAEAGLAYDEESFKPEAFAALKASGRLPFQAVPVWEEDGLRLAQSQAIANHIGRAHGLRGATARDEALIDQAFGAVEDVRAELRKLATAPAERQAAVRAELTTSTLPRWFGFLEKLLASNHGGAGFIVGDKPTVADFALWYLLEIAKDNNFGSALGDCPKLNAFFDRIAQRPRIVEYLKSPKRWPLLKLP